MSAHGRGVDAKGGCAGFAVVAATQRESHGFGLVWLGFGSTRPQSGNLMRKMPGEIENASQILYLKN